jgi:hypothetical protein
MILYEYEQTSSKTGRKRNPCSRKQDLFKKILFFPIDEWAAEKVVKLKAEKKTAQIIFAYILNPY